MNNEQRKKLFVRFLKENNIYHKFQIYFKKSRINDMIINDERTIDNLIITIINHKFVSFNEITLAFKWDEETKEGYHFWYNLSNKLNDILELYKKNIKT